MVLANLHYLEARWLCPVEPDNESRFNWREIALDGHTAHESARQIAGLRPILADWWQVHSSPRTGNPVYVEPSVIVLYRSDHRFTLDTVIPRRVTPVIGNELVIAAQPFRARHPAETKVRLVVASLAAAIAKVGRMITIQSTGKDPGMEIIRRVRPGEEPFQTPGPVLVQELRSRLEADFPERGFSIDSEQHAYFRYSLHVMPNEVTENIGTSTRLATWNAAVYVARIEDERITRAMSEGACLDATAEVVARHGGLRFVDESLVVVRRERGVVGLLNDAGVFSPMEHEQRTGSIDDGPGPVSHQDGAIAHFIPPIALGGGEQTQNLVPDQSLRSTLTATP